MWRRVICLKMPNEAMLTKFSYVALGPLDVLRVARGKSRNRIAGV